MKFVRSDIEWQDVIEKMAEFDEQIAEAMRTIQSLREQLDAKEKELQKAKLERDMDRETPWIQEQSETFEMVYRNRIINVPHELDYGQREHQYLGDNEDLVKLLEAERADTADAMCILQGAVRELQWALYDYKGKDGEASSLSMAKEPHSFSSNEGFVKVHASHLEDLDRFIIDLKLKADEAEKRARNAEVALAIKAVKEAAKSTESGSALVTFEKDWNDNKILKSMGGDVGLPYISNSLRKTSQFERKYPDTTIRTLRHGQKWSEGSPESWQIWDLNGTGR
jgi:chromosome segregation ATPase